MFFRPPSYYYLATVFAYLTLPSPIKVPTLVVDAIQFPKGIMKHKGKSNKRKRKSKRHSKRSIRKSRRK